jgi:hypothetical protein
MAGKVSWSRGGISSCFCTSLIGNLNIIYPVMFSYNNSREPFNLLTAARENNNVFIIITGY